MAKKIKPAKKAASKKTTKKKVARPVSPKKKKAASKKVVAKKKIVKKAATKKALAKKKTVKKAVAKPASRKGKKPAARKALVKKAAPKKAVTRKVIVKKAAEKKIPAKKVVAAKVVAKPTAPVVQKKVVLVEMPKPEALPPVVERSDDLVAKAANLDTGAGQVVPGDELNDAPLITADPVRTFSQNEFNKGTLKGELHSNLRFNSKPKNAVKPSGKKPLWNK